MKKTNISGDMVISAIVAIAGIVAMFTSLHYGIWQDVHPDKGFMPFLASGLMTISSIVWFVQAARPFASGGAAAPSEPEGAREGTTTGEVSKNELFWVFAVPVICTVTVFLMRFLGTSIALAIFQLLWLRLISKYSWIRTILFTVLLSAVFYGIFTLWLHVPFPTFSLF